MRKRCGKKQKYNEKNKERNTMVKVDLITGFLGSGKTTFIKNYARYLMDQGLNIGILENDFGAINVDMMLLRELEGEKCELEMVAGGCDKDCYRRRFKTKLIAMGMCGYDRVLIEPSGIFDVDDFFDALHEEPLDRWYQICNVITVVDVGLEENLSKEADYVLASEAANAGCVLLSKVQNVSEEQLSHTVAHINRALEAIHCPRVLKEEVIRKDWNDFTEQDYKEISESGYLVEDYEKIYTDQQTGKNFNRPRYQVLKEDILRTGDILIITELDRLGRNKQETLKELQYYRDKQIRVMILEIPTTLQDLSALDNSMAQMIMETINNMLIELYATMAQAEIEKKEKRQQEGIAAKKARGEWDEYGRPKAQKPDNWNEVITSWKNGEITAVKAMELTGLKKTTFYKLAKEAAV